MKNRSLASLEALRGIAALLVVVLHAQETFAIRTGVTPFAGLFSGGGRGVGRLGPTGARRRSRGRHLTLSEIRRA